MVLPERIQARLDIAVDGLRDLKSASSAMDDLQDSLFDTAAAGEGAESEMSSLNRELREIGSSSGTASGGLTGLQGEMAATSATANVLEDDVEDLSNAYDGLGSDMDSIEDFFDSMNRYYTQIDFDQDISGIVDDLDGGQESAVIDKLLELQDGSNEMEFDYDFDRPGDELWGEMGQDELDNLERMFEKSTGPDGEGGLFGEITRGVDFDQDPEDVLDQLDTGKFLHAKADYDRLKREQADIDLEEELTKIDRTLSGGGGGGTGDVFDGVDDVEETKRQVSSLNREIREMAMSSGVASGGVSGLQGEMVATSTLAKMLEGDIDDLNDADIEVAADKLARVLQSGDVSNMDMDLMQDEVDALDTDVLSDYLEVLTEADGAGEALEMFNEQTDGVGPRFSEISEGLEDLQKSGLPDNIRSLRQAFGQEFVDDPFEEGGMMPDVPLEYMDTYQDPGLEGGMGGPSSLQMSDVDADPDESHLGIDDDVYREMQEKLLEAGFESAGDVVDADYDELEDALDDHVEVAQAISSTRRRLDSMPDDERRTWARGNLVQQAEGIVDNLVEEGGIEALAGMGGGDVSKLADLEAITDAWERTDTSAVDAVTGDRTTIAGARIDAILDRFDDSEDFTKGSVFSEIDEYFLEAGRQRGEENLVRNRLQGDERTQADVLKDFFGDVFESDVSDEVQEALLEEGFGTTTLPGQKGLHFERPPLMRSLGIDEVDPKEAIGDGDVVDNVAESLTEFGQLIEEFPELSEALEDAPNTGDISDIVDNVEGEAIAELNDFVDDYEDTLNTFDLSDIRFALNDFDSEDDLIEGMRDTDNLDLSAAQRGFLSEAITELRPESTEGGGPQDPIPREVLQGQLLNRASRAEHDAVRQQLFSLYRQASGGELGVTGAMPQVEGFQRRLQGQIESDLLDEGIVDDEAASRVARSLSEGLGAEFEQDDSLKVLSDVLHEDPQRLGRVARRSVDYEDVPTEDLGEIIRVLADASEETRRDRLGDELESFLDAFEGATLPDDAERHVAGEDGQRYLPRGAGVDSDTFNTVSKEMEQSRGEAPVIRGFTQMMPGDWDGLGDKLAEVRREMGGTARESNRARDALTRVTNALSNMAPTLDATSANLGPFNLAMGRMIPMFMKLSALIGPLIVSVLGLASAFVTLTGVVGGFVGVGAITFLGTMADQMAGVNNRMEAAQELASALKDELLVAIEPLQQARLGGRSGVGMFVDLLQYGVELVGDISSGIANLAEMPVVANSVERITTAMTTADGGIGGMESMERLANQVLPIITEFTTYLINNFPEWTAFMSEVTSIMMNGLPFMEGWGGALANIGELLVPIIKYGVTFLSIIGSLIWAVTEVVAGFRSFIHELTTFIPGVEKAIPVVDYLAMAIGGLVAYYYAYAAATSYATIRSIILMGNWGGLTFAANTLTGAVSRLAGAMIWLNNTQAAAAIRSYAVTAAQYAQAAASYALSGAVWALNAAMSANPVVLFAGALIAVGAAIGYLLVETGALSWMIGGLNDAFTKLWKTLTSFMSSFNFGDWWDENVKRPFDETVETLEQLLGLFDSVNKKKEEIVGGNQQQQGTTGTNDGTTAGSGGNETRSGRAGRQRVDVTVENNGAIGMGGFERFLRDLVQDVLNKEEQKSGPIQSG